MTWLSTVFIAFGALVILGPLGWIGVTALQRRSDDRYQLQQDRLEQRYRNSK